MMRSRPRLMFPPPTSIRTSFSAGVTRAEIMIRLSSGATLRFAIDRYTRMKRILPSIFSEEL